MLEGLQQGISGLAEDITEFVAAHPIKTAAIGAGIAGVAIGATTLVRKRKKTKRKTATRKKAKRKKGKKLKFGSKAWRKKYVKKGRRKRISPKYARTAGKGKDRSTKRIRMTKHGQPYVILASGKARFIKKSSAKRSRKLKGGRY